jgi:uncharacterized protein (TIGR02421 family)
MTVAESQPREGDCEFEALQSAVRERLAQNQRIRRTLPGGGRLRIDRQLPFLCIHRQPPDFIDEETRELVTTEAAYLFASGAEQYRAGIAGLCSMIQDVLREHFGILLFLEIWAQPSAPDGRRLHRPAFRIVAPDGDALPTTLEAFEHALSKIRIDGASAEVALSRREAVAPPELPPLVAASTREAASCVYIGLEVRPIYRNSLTGEVYPLVLQRLRRQLSKALRRAIFAFTGMKAAHPKMHFDSLGPSALVKATRLVDQQLCDVSESFDFVLQATPVNFDQAWSQFCETHYESMPPLEYRPLPYHPSQLKRRLYEIPIERIEDPTLAHLFWEKQEELDRQISALRDLGTPRFLQGSLQLYGAPDKELVGLAKRVLEADRHKCDDSEEGCLDASAVAQRAREEIDFYHARLPSFNARVQVCDHIAAGLMVAQDQLLVAESLQLAAHRVEPLLHHEVGTHLLTYFNGREQPFRQLYAGLAGCETLQEGLALLAEYVAGGLTCGRLRTLAARVIAVQMLVSGADFHESFRKLHDDLGFGARSAFTTAVRVFRGGGLTKDIIYLRGLRDLLAFLRQGHEIAPLYVGKIALEHVPYVQELRRRGVIRAPALLPRFWEQENFQARVDALRGQGVLDLVECIR